MKEPAREVFVRYVGDPAVNNIRIYAHCQDEHSRPAAPLVITHAWSEGGVPKATRVRLEQPREYEVETGPDPVDELIEMTVPNGLR